MKDEIKEKKVEWHYLQENPSDLPKNREKVLLLVKLNDKWNRTEVLVGYCDFGDCLGEYCKDWGYFEPVKNIYYDFVDEEEVIAWKEIVLPEENEKAKTMSVEEQLEYAKTIIQDLLDNSDEYARQRAINFLEEVE